MAMPWCNSPPPDGNPRPVTSLTTKKSSASKKSLYMHLLRFLEAAAVARCRCQENNIHEKEVKLSPEPRSRSPHMSRLASLG